MNDSQILYSTDLSGELTLTKEGEWLHEGSPISHARLSALLHRSICWSDEENRYTLRLGKGEAKFHIEDVPFFVSELSFQDDGRIEFVLLSGSRGELLSEGFFASTDGVLYVRTANGDLARLRRSAHQQIACYVESDRSVQALGKTYPVNPLPENSKIEPI